MHIYTKLLFVISLKFEFNWTSCIVSGELSANGPLTTSGTHIGKHQKQETHSGHRKQHKDVWDDRSQLNYAKRFSTPNLTELDA